MYSKLIHALGFLILGIFLLHFAATLFDWYNRLWWFDIPMHILGGAFIGLSFFYVFVERRHLIGANSTTFGLFCSAVGLAMTIGVLWEFYEYVTATELLHQFAWGASLPNGLFDTLHDLLNDMIGAAGAAALYLFIARRREKKADA